MVDDIVNELQCYDNYIDVFDDHRERMDIQDKFQTDFPQYGDQEPENMKRVQIAQKMIRDQK